jgi:hypothetical protein
MYTVQ